MNKLHRFTLFVVGLVLVSWPSLAASQPAKDAKPIPVERTWDGEAKLELRKEIPSDGYVASQEAWAKLWKTFRGDEKLPEVDFDKELVLVAMGRDPNSISIAPMLSTDGDLRIAVQSTLIGFINPTTGKYQFAVIRRDGIKTVAGKPLPK